MFLVSEIEMLFFGARLRVLQDELSLAPHRATHFDGTIDLGDLGGRLSDAALQRFSPRGRPPVMSFVFAIFRGVFASKAARPDF